MLLVLVLLLGAEAQTITQQGECKAVGQPSLALSKGVCVLTGKVLFTAGGFSSLVSVKGDCNKYGPLFNSSEVVACIHTHGDGNMEEVLPEGAMVGHVGVLTAYTWTLVGWVISIPFWVFDWVVYPLWYYEHWMIVDSIVGGAVVAAVVYWFGFRGKKPAARKNRTGGEVHEIASTASHGPPPADGTPKRQRSSLSPDDMDTMYHQLASKVN